MIYSLLGKDARHGSEEEKLLKIVSNRTEAVQPKESWKAEVGIEEAWQPIRSHMSSS